ncbi:MAG TPA: sensor domain-containing diguanylate cyclase [Actinomycetota bacterium]|nr:sensor domain-containing diguanylate cyclase [Actinomycetota bacterium]
MSQSSAASGARPQTSELVSLAERMGFLQALRVGFAVVVLTSALFASKVIGASLADVTMFTAAYLLLSATAEGLRRAGRGRGLAVVGGMLLIDGVYLAWVTYVTGGTDSPLRFLLYLHLIAVTLLASYRTGLKIALWHSLLFFVVFYGQAAEILDPVEQAAAEGTLEASSVFTVLGFFVFALGTAVFSSINERELRRRKVDLEALTDMAGKMEQQDEADDVASALLDHVCGTFGFNRGAVVAAPSGGVPSLMAFRGPGEPPEAKAGIDAVMQRAWDAHETVLVKQLDPDADPQLAALLPFARNLVVTPLFAEGHPLGVLVVEYSPTGGTRIERRVVAMVSQFASHASLALRNSWLLQQVKKMADTDALTGVPNRRTFENVLDREVSRAGRNGEQVTLVMFDIDHFKSINDTHGHQMGDEVLKKVASTIAAGCRDFDVPARYGGEEFAVVLPSCSSKESLVVAERLRRSIGEADNPVPITASAGVATFPTHAADPERLIAAADEALYESKRAGRDRVTRSRRRGAAAGKAVPVE